MFISIYLDEDVDLLIAELVAARGFTATTARDEGQLRRSDAEQLDYAVARRLCMVTHNRRHFKELHDQYMAAGRTHAGIIIAFRKRPYIITDRLTHILQTITADEMRNQLLYI